MVQKVQMEECRKEYHKNAETALPLLERLATALTIDLNGQDQGSIWDTKEYY